MTTFEGKKNLRNDAAVVIVDSVQLVDDILRTIFSKILYD